MAQRVGPPGPFPPLSTAGGECRGRHRCCKAHPQDVTPWTQGLISVERPLPGAGVLYLSPGTPSSSLTSSFKLYSGERPARRQKRPTSREGARAQALAAGVPLQRRVTARGADPGLRVHRAVCVHYQCHFGHQDDRWFISLRAPLFISALHIGDLGTQRALSEPSRAGNALPGLI